MDLKRQKKKRIQCRGSAGGRGGGDVSFAYPACVRSHGSALFRLKSRRDFMSFALKRLPEVTRLGF